VSRSENGLGWQFKQRKLTKLEQEVGIDLAVLMPEATLRPDNATLRNAAAQFNMFLPCACLRPKLGHETVEEFETAVKEWGFRWLKLMPPKHGYRIVKDLVYPLLQRAAELNVPVSIHSGQESCHPADIGFIALEFPDIPFMMDHMAHRYSER
jgi:predicted TIM-barrel fold metal-dependent hydrolase